MKDIVARLLAEESGPASVTLHASGWFDQKTNSQIPAVIEQYERYFTSEFEDRTSILGEPDQTATTHRSAVDAWYPAAIRAARWFRQGTVFSSGTLRSGDAGPGLASVPLGRRDRGIVGLIGFGDGPKRGIESVAQPILEKIGLIWQKPD